MINVVVPMAGKGSRFKLAGFIEPKPSIDVLGKPMIQWALDSISGLKKFQLIFIALSSDLNPHLSRILTEKGKIVVLDEITEGAVSSVLKANAYINNDNPLIILNCDQYIEWNINKFLKKARNYQGSVVVFKSKNPHHSFVSKKWKKITHVEEKIVISNLACGGVYYYRRGSDFVNMANRYMDKNLRTNGEFYITPVFNEFISDGKQITFYKVKKSKIHMLGTPEEVAIFKKKQSRSWSLNG